MKIEVEIPRWSQSFELKRSQAPIKGQGFFYFLGDRPEKKFNSIIEDHALDYQKEALLKNERETLHFIGSQGSVWIQRRSKRKSLTHGGAFQESAYTQARDGAGALVGVLRAQGIKRLDVEFWGALESEEVGFLVGLDLGAYQFRALFEGQKPLEGLPQVSLLSQGKVFSEKRLREAQHLASGVNWARHLVNLPGQSLNPQSFAALCEEFFKKSKTVKVSVWDEYRLQREKMNLHLAVGQGAHFGPRMVHLKYRPQGSKKKPVAVVGKGITFDTGGLDIKPSSGMRHMKKDMGGAAATFGLCVWLEQMNLDVPCDFYLAIAENSVGPKSFRPGDIFQARNGLFVEIHNTDAEGRLVLADVLDVAVKSKDKPDLVIDLATLTGAIKVALGADVPGLFSNDDALAAQLEKSSQAVGETCWRMPLVPKYASQMNSPVAHMTNAVDGFGGAITAAMFLERFVWDVPWAHIDIYAWNDKPTGGLGFTGGSGQGVQTMANFLLARSKRSSKRGRSSR
jgi:leucyl aminopeptidase